MRTHGLFNTRTHRLRILTAFASLALALPVQASFHFMQIEQVIGGVNGDTTAQALQLRMRSLGQRFTEGAKLVVFDAAGNNPVTLITFADASNGAAGARILAASANFVSYEATPITADFLLTNPIPVSYLAAGRLAYESPFGDILWSVSWGGASYTGPNTGTLDNDADGNFGPPFAGALPSTSTSALRFNGAATALSTNNAADYSVTAGTATFTNNAGGSTSLIANTVFLSPPKDNTLYEDPAGQLSNGQGIFLYTGMTNSNVLRRGLIAFDLASIPTNATITGATLSMFLSRSGPIPSADISLRKALRDWGEGASDAGPTNGGAGAQAEAGDATWIHNFYNTSFWTTPGGDFSPTLSATTPVSMENTAYTWSGSGLLADVQSWFSNPASNFGWAILGNEIDPGSAKQFNTGENSSNPPKLTVTYQLSSPTPTPAAQTVNLSTRMFVQTGDNVGIGGFIITGSAPKHVLLRVIGPSLIQFGILDALADPVLELHGPGAFATITNNNWRDDSAQEQAILATGLAPTNNLESAIDATLNPGIYTAIVSGNGNTLGVALIEVYDLSQAVLAKLVNISTRAFVSTNDHVVIAGFILGNHNGADRIVVRGIGPSLTGLGVPNVLTNPTLELRDSNGALLISNNDWQDDPAQASELSFAGLAPTNNLEAAIATTLPPGLYTALLAGLNNGIGNGVVEVYDRGAP